jgi:hypothetical protein
MIEELADLLDSFPGAANQTRCFTHVLNLVAKSIIKQFDVPKSQAGQALDEAAEALATLAVDLDLEEILSRTQDDNEPDDLETADDNVEGWADLRNELSEEDKKVLDESLQPIRLVLVKVSHQLLIDYYMIKSNNRFSCAKLHLQSRTHPLLSFHDG